MSLRGKNRIVDLFVEDRKMKKLLRNTPALLAIIGALLLVPTVSIFAGGGFSQDFTDDFPLDNCRISTKGDNLYFPLKPGTLFYEGDDDGEWVELQITILRRHEIVNGIKCRIIEEVEWIDGELVEISRNYFGACRRDRGLYYFGEDVDIYEDGEIVSHEGAWRAGENGAKHGLMMSGRPLLGSRYYQEIAPGVAEDRAENLSLTETVDTPAGTFTDCLMVEETTPLEPGEVEYKYYAPGVGLIQDGPIKLVSYFYK